MVRRAVALVIALSACREPSDPGPAVEVGYYAAAPSTKLDVLFQIDNSASVDHLHASLAASLPPLLAHIDHLDLHIGVITSDMGTSGSIGDPASPIGSVGQGGCADRGDDGALQTSGAAVNDLYIVDEDDGLGGRRRNYNGELASVLGQMVRLGSGGCGFEQPLAATRRALVSDANTGFARNDANLLVVMLMDEDDCSVVDPQIFGPASATLGPLQSFRCTRFGVECDQSLDDVGSKTGCRASASPYIEDVGTFVDALRVVRGHPARVGVAAIAGPPDVAVELRASPGGGGSQDLALAHACRWDDGLGGNVADPAVRVAAVIEQLAPNSAFSSVCSEDFSTQVADIARVADGLYGITCLDPALFGPEPQCSVVLESLDGSTPLSLCPAPGDCIEIVGDPDACGDRPRLVVNIAAPRADQFVRAHCRLAGGAAM